VSESIGKKKKETAADRSMSWAFHKLFFSYHAACALCPQTVLGSTTASLIVTARKKKE
jgi:hypothetical protein